MRSEDLAAPSPPLALTGLLPVWDVARHTAVKALGAERLGVGEIWEWTSTPHADGGHAVRGGRWRDVPALPPAPANRSFATSPATDLGFRCVV